MEKQETLYAQCHCAKVGIKLTHRPEYINDCNCSLCRKSGGLWGYFSCADVTVTGETQPYSRKDRDEPAVQIHFCKLCSSTTHWTLTPAFLKTHPDADRMGVNMRLFEQDTLRGIELRFPDGKNWSGEGDYRYRKAPLIFGDDEGSLFSPE